MDGRNNNQLNPQNTQNRQLTNPIPAELNHILQNGLTPEQYAENSRQLENYRHINAVGLQVYLQRQHHQAEQRRQEELRLLQLAQQLGSGSQQQLQRQLPPAPLPPHSHQSLLPQQAVSSGVMSNRNTSMPIYNHGQSYNTANTNNVPRRWSHQHMANVHHQPHRPSVNTSVPLVNQNVYTPQAANRVSHATGGVGGSAAPALHTSQIVQPKAALNFVHQSPQYPQHPGIAVTGSQTNTGQGGASGATATHASHQLYGSLKELYPSWVKAYGDVKATSMAREHLQSWQQGRQMHPTVPTPMQSVVAPPTTLLAPQNSQTQNQNQTRGWEGAAAPPLSHPQSQDWSSVPVVSTLEPQPASQPHPAAPSTYTLRADDSAFEAVVGQTMSKPTDPHNDTEMQSHHLEATAIKPAVTSTDFASTPSALPSSQSGSTQSILLASEEKGTALYTMRGLAASIKRSLNAEKLAASAQPPASSDLHSQKRKRSSSAEAIDTPHEAELGRPNPVTGSACEQRPLPKADSQPVDVLDDSPSTMPVTFPDVSIPQQEIIHTPNELPNSDSRHDSIRNFVPFSTLTGAVSFDNITDSVPANHDLTYPSEAMGVLEDLATAQPTAEIVLRNHVEAPLIPVSQASFDPLSLSHRTPTPPLVATITPLHDEDEVDEKAEATPSSHPSTLLHEEEVNSQLQFISSGSEDDLEASASLGKDHVQVHFNITSESRDNDSPMQEADFFVRRTGLLDSSIGEIDYGQTGSPEAVASETKSPVRTPEELQQLLARTSPTRVQGPGSVETLDPDLLPKVGRKIRGKQEFYVSVPPPSEWVLKAKHGEAERKKLMSEKSGQRSNREYTDCELANRLCPRHCHWSGCQAVLNSMYALKQHVRRHQLEVEPVGPGMTVSCRWKQCRMVCERSSLLLHLNRHVDKEVTCIYDDCDERFSRIQDLAEHEKNEHADDDPPPSAVPRPPDLKSVAALPQTVPSYTTTTRPVSKPSITVERHARLGPWALGMIIGHPMAGPDGDGLNTTLRARRTTRLSEKAPDVVVTPTFPGYGNTEEMKAQWAVYDLLEEPSVEYTQDLGELDSVEVTREFYEGGKVRGGSPLSGSTSDDVQTVEALLDC